MMALETFWGNGEHLLPYQMGIRALVMFLLALVLIRLGGMRIFGKKSALDHIIVIMLGAVMARGIVGASPFFSTVVAGAILVLTNWLLAYSSRKSRRWSAWIKGRPLLLFHDGHFDEKNMRQSNLCRDDVLESLRLELQQENLEEVNKIYIENNGRLSFILKRERG